MKVKDLMKVVLPKGSYFTMKGNTIIVSRRQHKPLKHVDMSNIILEYHPGMSKICTTGIGDNPNIIYFNTLMPKERYNKVEQNIEYILLHENLHQIIQVLEGYDVSSALDDLIPGYEETMQWCKEIYER